jgi:two-component system, chemotaxis family, sensor kinase Cph1
VTDPGDMDLSACDREPIHVPGAIQPHGVLLSLREPDLQVLQVSDNTAAHLDLPPDAVLRERLTGVLDASSVETVLTALASGRPSDHNPLALRRGDRHYDGILHRHDGATVLELEPAAGGDALSHRDHPLRAILAPIQAAEDLQTLLASAVRGVQRLTGFERVLAYRFDAEGHGEVMAEVCAPDQTPYLGLRYPASDIPRQARELYRINPMRLIPTPDYEPAELVPPLRPDTGTPLDLSLSVLRSVSPVHRQYMRNMGVRASMSLSLLHNGRLWGLLGCLQREPRHVPFETRALCEVVARVASLQITALEEMEASRLWAERQIHMQTLVSAMRTGTAEVLEGLPSQGDALLALVDATGAAVCLGDHVRTVGEVPPPEALARIRGSIEDDYEEGLFCSDALPRRDPSLEPHRHTASGLLAVRLPRADRQEVIWFRPEVMRTVQWGGDARKPVEPDASGQLHPRRSFALWEEEVRLSSPPWHPVERAVAADLRRHAVEIDLHRQVQRAIGAVRARDDMAAVVSHELRGPLWILKMQGSLLQAQAAEGDTEGIDAAAQQLQRAVAQMERIIDDLLDAARIDAGHLRVKLRRLQLQWAVERVLEAFLPQARSRGVVLVQDVPPDLHVCADDDRLFQVLSNLIANALRHTDQDGRITVHAHATDPQVQVTVSDTGPGIPPEMQPRLFERYWQAGSSQGAAGLGLYICRGLVEAHGGRIWVESEPGHGTHFHFTLPAYPHCP